MVRNECTGIETLGYPRIRLGNAVSNGSDDEQSIHRTAFPLALNLAQAKEAQPQLALYSHKPNLNHGVQINIPSSRGTFTLFIVESRPAARAPL
ncbi:hypothetical protein ZHAS_00007942 [Anopheles sinensis]|uniref:Uncharacterized protein n=1 Tax=Anopheles sinensis TaxID=74873 RepID=A0A084VR42_ANOSI|nr:hypothetical protein ZHAS_00007942 [Anopheles sinensis]